MLEISPDERPTLEMLRKGAVQWCGFTLGLDELPALATIVIAEEPRGFGDDGPVFTTICNVFASTNAALALRKTLEHLVPIVTRLVEAELARLEELRADALAQIDRHTKELAKSKAALSYFDQAKARVHTAGWKGGVFE